MGREFTRRHKMVVSLMAVAVFFGVVAIPPAGAQEVGDGDRPTVQFLIDVSGSMAGSRLLEAQDALRSGVSGLADDQVAGLRSFAGGCSDAGDLLVTPSSGSAGALNEAVDGLAAGGGTPTPAALEAAANDLAGIEGPRVVVLISDGLSTCGDPCPAAVDLKARLGLDFRAVTVGFQASEAAAEELDCIAEATGGEYVAAEDTEGLADAIGEAVIGDDGDDDDDPLPTFECTADDGNLTWTSHEKDKYWVYKSTDAGQSYHWIGRTLGDTTFTDVNHQSGDLYQVHYAHFPRTDCSTNSTPDNPDVKDQRFVCQVDSKGRITWTDHGQAKYWIYRSVDHGKTYEWLGRTFGPTSFEDHDYRPEYMYQVHYQGIDRKFCDSGDGLWRMNVVSLSFLPPDPSDSSLWDQSRRPNAPIAMASRHEMRDHIHSSEITIAETMENGSRSRRGSGLQSLVYQTKNRVEFAQQPPDDGNGRPDYLKILGELAPTKLGVADFCAYIDSKEIDEVWIWTDHDDVVAPMESKMSSPRNMPYVDISNSPSGDVLPHCGRTYVMYNYNFTREPETGVHNHMHQIENVLGHRPDSPQIDKDLFSWKGDGSDPLNVHGHRINQGAWSAGCGDSHWVPTTAKNPNVPDNPLEYDYDNGETRTVVCSGWQPDGKGAAETLTCAAWGCSEMNYYIWWMQHLMGDQTGLSYNGQPLTNWWRAIGDFDSVAPIGGDISSRPRLVH